MNAPFLSNAADANVIEPVNPFEVTLNLDCWNGGLPSEPLENLNAVLSVSNSNNLTFDVVVKFPPLKFFDLFTSTGIKLLFIS